MEDEPSKEGRNKGVRSPRLEASRKYDTELMNESTKSVFENVCSSHFSGRLKPKSPTKVGTTYAAEGQRR